MDGRVTTENAVAASRGRSVLRWLVAVLSVSVSLVATATASAAVVTTGEPKEIFAGGAMFTGTVTDVVPGSIFHFEVWWDSYPQHVDQTTTEPLPPDPEVHVTQEHGLSPSTAESLYYTYRLVVEEPGGVVVGQPVSFQMPPTLFGKAPPPPGMCRVRKVTGLRLADARRVLSHAPGCEQIGIVVLPQQGHHLHARRRYRVVSQSPRAGSRIPSYHSSLFLRVKQA